MALIKCPECNGNVSSKATACPHCGFPMQKQVTKSQTIIYEGKQFDVASIVTELKAGKYSEAYCDVIEEICTNLPSQNSCVVDDIIDLICTQYKIKSPKPVHSAPTGPKCPTCGSTNLIKVGVGARAIDGFFFGRLSVEGRAQFACRDCNYRW